MKLYKLNLNNSESYIHVVVCKTVKKMQKAVQDSEHIDTANSVAAGCGCFCPNIIIVREDQVFTSQKIGTMYLNEKDLGVGVVSHECLHASMAIERYKNRFCMDYGDGQEDLEDEERLCYLLTYLTTQVYDILYTNKHIKKKK